MKRKDPPEVIPLALSPFSSFQFFSFPSQSLTKSYIYHGQHTKKPSSNVPTKTPFCSALDYKNTLTVLFLSYLHLSWWTQKLLG